MEIGIAMIFTDFLLFSSAQCSEWNCPRHLKNDFACFSCERLSPFLDTSSKARIAMPKTKVSVDQNLRLPKTSGSQIEAAL